ncbi:MAG: hypothetical protein ACXVCK_09965 [Bdellovibrionota bacterium]
MKKILFTLALFTQTLPAHAAWLKPILECDGGSAVVTVDLGERRNVQLTINDHNIADYFSRYHGYGSAMEIRDGRITVTAGLLRGIFNSSEFRGFESDVANAPAVQVFRDGSGLRVRLTSLAHKECIDWRANDYYCAETRDVGEVEYASWFFRSCAEKPANP